MMYLPCKCDARRLHNLPPVGPGSMEGLWGEQGEKDPTPSGNHAAPSNPTLNPCHFKHPLQRNLARERVWRVLPWSLDSVSAWLVDHGISTERKVLRDSLQSIVDVTQGYRFLQSL